MTILPISELNKGWGICGFASALAALHQNGIFSQAIDHAINKQQLKTRLLAEIKTYLVILKSENQTRLLNEITRFTRTFSGFQNFTIDNYISKINSIAVSEPSTSDDQFSIAMPPNAVIDYIKRIGGMKHALMVKNANTAFDNVILGLSKSDHARVEWSGLGHWVYKKNNAAIYNWGEKLTSTQFQQLMSERKWHISHQILLRQ